MRTERDVIEWFVSNRGTVCSIVHELDKKKMALLSIEPSVFHDDIQKEFYDLSVQKIADLITLDLAIPIEMVYNTIEDKKLLVDSLRT